MRTLILILLASNAFARKTTGGGSTRHGTHTYPSTFGHSGTGTHGSSASYPPSTGYSGNNHVPKHTNQYNVHHTQRTEVHHHHHYSPPQQIGYGSHSYPVYHGTPPVYVYQYRDSGSRFDTLLTGLALYNLGRMSSHHNSYDPNKGYRGNPGEVCKLGIRKSNVDYEETRVDCQLMSSFILSSPTQTHVEDQQSEKKTITSTVVQTTNNGPNGTSTVTVTNTTVEDALKSKGESIKVTPEMECYLIHTTPYKNSKKPVDCGLLQMYAQRSFNSAEKLTPIAIFVFVAFLFQVMRTVI